MYCFVFFFLTLCVFLSLSLERKTQKNQKRRHRQISEEHRRDACETEESKPARAEEGKGRRGRRDERTKTKRGRKSIIAENAQPTKHHKKNSGFRQLSRTPLFKHRKQSILEKAATNFGFWGRDRHYVSSGFVRFFSENRKHGFDAQERRPVKTSRFFVCPAQSYQKAFNFGGANPILSEKVRFEKPLRQKNLFLPRNLEKGLKNRTKNREERHK